MKWTDNIASIFTRGRRFFNGGSTASFIGWEGMSKHIYSDAVFLNCVELLTDLCHDVTWRFDGTNPGVEKAFVRLFNTYGKYILNRLYTEGYCVLKHTSQGEGANAAHEIGIAQPSEYTKHMVNEWTEFISNDPEVEIYVMRSPTYQASARSDKFLLAPFLEYLDNTLNASNTVSARMGALVVCSPKNPSNAPMATVLDEEEKKEIEEQMGKEYGALAQQRIAMVLPREMSFQVISLATLDLKTADKVKMAVCAIADRLKVPANQVGMIDANSSKTLSNGSELREGDFNKYQSFERLIDQTFVQLARDCRLRPGMVEGVQGVAVGSYYTIYNKPEQPKTAL